MVGYKIAAPDEYLAITGMGVDGEIKITKSAWLLPFQKCMRFSVQPQDYVMSLQAMTKEKLQFLLPVVFTVGPWVPQTQDIDSATADDVESGLNPVRTPAEAAAALHKYAVLLAESEAQRRSGVNAVEQKIKSIVEGEVRVLVSSMTIEEIFNQRELFKKRIQKNIQTELDQFGLRIYNANVKELRDAPQSVYFESLSRKAHEGATNQARIDVAAAQLRGNVGEADRKGEQEREIAKINADTAVQKTERDIERAQAEAKLDTKRTILSRDVEISRIEARRATESRDEDLKRQVELKRRDAEMERMRAVDVVKAVVSREAKQQAADAKAYEVEADARAAFTRSEQLTNANAYKLRTEAGATAEADFQRVTKNTDAAAYKTRADADANSYAAAKNAEALLTKQKTEAEGIAAMADAYAKMANAFGGPQGLLQFMMIEKGTYVELAKANATAVRGMEPKISVWTTGEAGGSGGSGSNAGVDTMRNVYQMLPPLMTTINEQTGITLPEWQFGKMAVAVNEVASKKT
ncbi:uncharacterized protein BROUX77_007401 [Berkeleyomyces rouxiae]|uniref:uncharacterized protein n=1 Tax=Berkeleyomyces rouxiae TaxID=2035830 RepID=UPI003B7CB16B